MIKGKETFAVEWRDHRNHRRMKGMGTGANAKRLAKQEAQRLDAELRSGKYDEREREKERRSNQATKDVSPECLSVGT
jgi:hypothetical protein